MGVVKNCTECGNNDRCLQMIKDGVVVMCGSTLCRPIKKGITA